MAYFGFFGPDINVDGVFAFVHAVLHRVLHDGLQGEGWHAEKDIGRVEGDEENVFKLCLLDGEVSAGMLKLIHERNGGGTCDGGEVLAEVGGEIQCDLLRFGGSWSQR